MKFNIDGSAKGCPCDAGIGGVLTDHVANIKIVFSEYVGVVDSNLAELLAIECLKNKVGEWDIVHILREANEIADGLAKRGAARKHDIVAYF
ncbi:hypothetical protein PTKIN_Ptkin10aG0103000 [Pterospermum kingtungense]